MKKKAAIKIASFVLFSIVVICLILLSVLFIISGGFIKQTYLEPWSKDYAANHSDPRVRLAASGLLAASNHNMQPWKIRLDKSDNRVFYLYADSSRMINEVDPYARQMMISQGTFLEYIAVAGKKEGWSTKINLFPNGTYDESNLAESMDVKPVAKITLSKAQPENNPLYEATFLPDTNRETYKMEMLSSSQVSVLESLSPGKGVSIKLYQDEANLKKIGGYALRSAAIEADVERIMDESGAIFRANEYQKNKYRYGYSVEGQGTSGSMKHILQGLLTVFPSLNTGKAASKNFIDYTRTSVDNTPVYAMIITSDSSRSAQVESGMLYSKLVLTGHTLGLVMQPLSQVLEEYSEMSIPYTEFQQTYAPNGGTVQMLFRLGKPTKSTPLSMRRDVMDLIIEE
ncbi:hypothetical protein KM800_03440 [Clostridium tyrobutyricum]|uniref:Acg family FMN-binding oxidoreductase n=1 Tax=Clostridium tyrobutyricum TaxID=1519 RepID=UPI001C392AF1|nr:hypothetical protein [Clostridium tyrobutyricum]MBV4418385.1 hypothetical protein [Clostridium tyrobutyricum]